LGVTLTATQIDPRDETWEEWDPACLLLGLACDEWELVECEVEAALHWANASAHGRPFTLHAVVKQPGEVGLIRLLGSDPTRA